MKRTCLAIACLACLALAACGGGESSKKPITKRDQSSAPKFQGSTGETKSKMIEGDDPTRKP